MSQQYFPEQYAMPLSTPEICKMIMSDPMHDALASYPSPMPEDHATIVSGLMSDFDELASNTTMVNPDDVCFGGQQQHMTGMQQAGFPFYDNGYSSSSFPSSPESLNGMNINQEQSMTLTNFNMCAPSPAGSTDSGASFYNLDQQQPPMIKQEIEFPSVIEEINQQQPCQMSYQQQPQQYMQSPPQYMEQQYLPVYQQQQPADGFNVPTTVPTLINSYHQPMMSQQQQILPPQQQQHQQMVQVRLPSATSSVPSSSSASAGQVAGRKRSPNGAFVSTSESSTTSTASASGPGTKKARLTKRQKQQQMDKQVEEYTQKNKDLRNQIELLERKVQFCTQFLQKYVSPIVQGRQNTWTEVVNGEDMTA